MYKKELLLKSKEIIKNWNTKYPTLLKKSVSTWRKAWPTSTNEKRYIDSYKILSCVWILICKRGIFWGRCSLIIFFAIKELDELFRDEKKGILTQIFLYLHLTRLIFVSTLSTNHCTGVLERVCVTIILHAV